MKEVIDDGCVMTYDSKAIEIADVVVFHCAELSNDATRMPHASRNSNQVWIWYCLEPPWNTRYVFRKTLHNFDYIFNWTMTYRLDSDIWMGYTDLSLAFTNKSTIDSLSEVWNKKTADFDGAWVVSNCAASKRNKLIDELKDSINIMVYGKCAGNYLCRSDCMHEQLSKYKFYFSFKNSECKDYITEKFWTNALASNAVPVVLGGKNREDYEKIAPPNSFIHVNYFLSVKDLGVFLKNVSKSKEKYLKFLYWLTPQGKQEWKSNLYKLSEEQP